MDGKSSIFGEEKHGASEQLLVELGTRLHFMEGNDDVLEEGHMLISQGDCKSTDDTCKNV